MMNKASTHTGNSSTPALLLTLAMVLPCPLLSTLANATTTLTKTMATKTMATKTMAAKTMAGKTIITRGQVTAAADQGTGGAQLTPRRLKRRSRVFDNDVIKTAADSKAQLRMIDGGMIALKENSELVIADYRFDPGQQQGAVALELIKGGLRSVTGAIKAEKGHYQLTTPVGSIGVRGTHYELELVDDALFIAVWDGAIDVSLDIDGQPQQLSLGDNEDYAYARVRASGNITFMLEPPAHFRHGHSSDPNARGPGRRHGPGAAPGHGPGPGAAPGHGPGPGAAPGHGPGPGAAPGHGPGPGAVPGHGPGPGAAPGLAPPPGPHQTRDLEIAGAEPEAFTPPPNPGELVRARTGVVVYDHARELRVSGPNGQNISGQISDFQASMTIDFDHATIPEGSLSFSDNGGRWSATFDGTINAEQFDLDIHSATHGGRPADGYIEALFLHGLDDVLTNFELFEIDRDNIRVKGNFILR